MIKLLNAGFTRLRKNKIFWLLSVFSIGFAFVLINGQYGNMKAYGETVEMGALLFSYPPILGIVIAVFISLFLGAEYSDGAIRNKICIGHKRGNIYLSNFIISSIVSLFFYAIFLIATLAVGLPLFGSGTISITLILMRIFVVSFTIIAYSSIFTFIAMLCSNKTIIAVTTILVAFGLMLFTIYCSNVLNTPEYIRVASLVDGETQFKEEYNPKYPSPEKRKVYETLIDILPSGQTLQIPERDSNLGLLVVYSIGIIVVFTGSGFLLFKKKELK